ncbi:MAG: NAD-dependent epimerase/dehydratase family protein [Pseudomonadota bacterium]
MPSDACACIAPGTKVLVLGGDGFCGWPTALRLSAGGCCVTIIDNGSRRAIDRDLGTAPLVPIKSLRARVAAWAEHSSSLIGIRYLDLATDYEALCQNIFELSPDIVVHFAEQRSAPFSMRSSAGARYSVDNNIRATHNLLAALVETKSDPHLIHLGTVGVYGYTSAGLTLPEGYVKVTAHGADGRSVEREILYPGEPDSIYHMTKVLDQQMLAFYARYHNLTITDLHQGVVWGTQTAETRSDPRLVNRFDHDAIYGTVVNRFLVQARSDLPLTVYGSGTQTRAFIHIEDMVSCIMLAASTPPQRTGGRVRVVNQVGEVASINALARQVAEFTGAEIAHINNPRREPEGNSFDLDRSTFSSLGFTPRTFAVALPQEIAELTDFKANSAGELVTDLATQLEGAKRH